MYILCILSYKCLSYVILLGANVTQCDHDGYTPLVWAVYHGHVSLISLFLNCKEVGNVEVQYKEYRLSNEDRLMEGCRYMLD